MIKINYVFIRNKIIFDTKLLKNYIKLIILSIKY